ncbi:hypothetical protein SAY86_028336 [Trapa natans]|uniref:Bifunctional inhibitor/plant lipid transfer protein/seed storage helical domain-containing protein n=1 Tax=Trapa natans TaxID=22666 RepID=A0AAN7RC42_TRANT|nr:hypothetical protein SAY86_028336 [Trapa natans]
MSDARRKFSAMAPKSLGSAALFLSFNLLFFSLASSAAPVPSSQVRYPPKIPRVPGHSQPGRIPGHSYPAVPACPRDALKLGVCANVLSGLVHLVVGTPPKTSCCSLLSGLDDAEAAACLCTAIKASVLGINLNVPVSLNLLVNYCGRQLPYGFKCA